ncbi:MAG: PAQR family membrane homeostasis protein TrhA [Solirubrobacterales bacterium]
MTETAETAADGGELGSKPALRGVFHLAATPLALAGAIVLVATASDGRARLALAIYGAALVGLFGVSALYHRVHWRPGPRRWIRRLDHSMIFILTAATYTPFAVLVIQTTLGDVLLAVVWVGALGGVMLNLFWPAQPKWVASLAACALGPALLVSLVPLGQAAGIGAPILVGLGLVLYTAGAAVYGAQRPDPWPRTFGYHEIMHLLVVAAAAVHYAAVAIYAAPGG